METDFAIQTDSPPDLAFLLKELDSLRAGVALLGLRQCSCCGKYFNSADSKNLLKAGDLVCYSCVFDWWRRRSPVLALEERTAVEGKLLRWLVADHGAKVIRDARRLPEPDAIELKFVVACGHCGGIGRFGGAACQSCNGLGTEWVVVLKPQMR